MAGDVITSYPDELVIETEFTEGVWTDVTDLVDSKGIKIQSFINHHAQRAEFPPSAPSNDGYSFREYQRIRCKIPGGVGVADNRLFDGFMAGPGDALEGAEKYWDGACIGPNWLLSRGPKPVAAFTIPAFISDKAAIAGGTFTSPAWAASTPYLLGAQREPTVSNAHYYKVVSVRASWPTWKPLVAGTAGMHAQPTVDTGYYYKVSATPPAYGTWTALVIVHEGEIRLPLATPNNFYYKAIQSGDGTPAATEPTWPTTVGATVQDGTVKWRCEGRMSYTGSVEPVWPIVGGGTVTDGGVVWEIAGQNGVSGATQPTWPTGSEARVADGGVIWEEQGSTTFVGLLPTYLPEVATDAMHTVITSLPGHTLYDTTVQGVFEWIASNGNSSQQIGWCVTITPDNDAHTAPHGWRLLWYNQLDPAHVPFAEMDLWEDAPDATHAGYKDYKKERLATDAFNAPAVRGSNGAYYEIDPTIPALKTFTVNTTTDSFSSVGHDYENDDLVYAQSSGTLPAPLQEDVAYSIRNKTPDSYQLATGPDNPMVFTADPATDRLIIPGGHNYSIGDAVSLYTTGTLPAPLTTDTRRYVKERTQTSIKLSATPGGAVINITNAGSGEHTINLATIDITTTGSGTHQTFKYGSYQPAYESYLYLRLAISDGVRVDENLTTNEECRARCEQLVDHYNSGQDGVSLSTRAMIDPAILTEPRKVRLSHEGSGYDATEFLNSETTFSFGSDGIARFDHRLGATWPDPNDEKVLGFRGGHRFILDQDPPDKPTWAAGEGWILENIFDEASWTTRVQAQAILGGEPDLAMTYWRWQINDGDVHTDPIEVSPYQGFVQFIWPALPPDVTLTVAVEAFDGSGNHAGYGLLNSLTTAKEPAIPAPAVAKIAEGFDADMGMAWIDIEITPPHYPHVAGYRRYLYEAGVTSERDIGNRAVDRIYLTPNLPGADDRVYLVNYKTYNIWGRMSEEASTPDVTGSAPEYPAIDPPETFQDATPYKEPGTEAWQIPLSWEPPSDPPGTDYLSHYHLYKSTAGFDGPYYPANVGRTLNTTVSANQGTTLHFYMTSVDRWDNESIETSIIAVNVPLNISPDVPNGGFEDVAGEQPDSTAARPHRWIEDEVSGGTVRIDITNAMEGYRCVKFDTTPGGATAAMECEKVSVIAGRTIRASIFAKGASAGNIFTQKVRFYSWNGTAFTLISTKTPYSNAAVATDYVEKVAYLTVPAGAVAADMKPGKLTSSSNHLFVDDAHIQMVPIEPGRIGRNWVPIPTTGASAELTTGEVYTGTESLALSVTPVTPTDPDTIPDKLVEWVGDNITGSNADPVTDWPDTSGNDHDALDHPSAGSPTLRTGVANGHSVVRFTGSQGLRTATFDTLITQPVTFYIVADIGLEVGDTQYILFGDNPPSGTELSLLVSNSDHLLLATSTAGISTGEYAVTGDFMIISLVCNGASSRMRINGGAPITGNIGSDGFKRLTIGCDPGGSTSATVDMADLRMWEAGHSTETEDGMLAWLAAQYGVTLVGGGGGAITSEVRGPKTPTAEGTYDNFWSAAMNPDENGTAYHKVEYFDKTDTLLVTGGTITLWEETPTDEWVPHKSAPQLAPAGAAYFVEVLGFRHDEEATCYFDVATPAKSTETLDILPGSITTPLLDDESVTEPKLGEKSVTHSKIDIEAVEEDNLGPQSVTHGKLGLGAVEEDILGAEAVTNGKLGVITDPTRFAPDVETGPYIFYDDLGRPVAQLSYDSGTEVFTLETLSPAGGIFPELKFTSASGVNNFEGRINTDGDVVAVGFMEAAEFHVAGVKVVDNRGAAIDDADGTLASATSRINAILAFLRGWGSIAT